MYALHRINHHLTADGTGRDSIVMLDGSWRGGKIFGIGWPPNQHPYFSRPLGGVKKGFKFPKEALTETNLAAAQASGGSGSNPLAMTDPGRKMARSSSTPVLHRELQSSFSDWVRHKELREAQMERSLKLQRTRELYMSKTQPARATTKLRKSRSAAELGKTAEAV